MFYLRCVENGLVVGRCDDGPFVGLVVHKRIDGWSTAAGALAARWSEDFGDTYIYGFNDHLRSYRWVVVRQVITYETVCEEV